MAKYDFINIITGTVHTEKELRQIFCEEYDGDDPTNITPFAEWLAGMHTEQDKNGDPVKCIYKPIKEASR